MQRDAGAEQRSLEDAAVNQALEWQCTMRFESTTTSLGNCMINHDKMSKCRLTFRVANGKGMAGGTDVKGGHHVPACPLGQQGDVA